MSARNWQGRTGVVVPAIAAPSSVTCVRSLGRRGIPTIAASERADAAAFRSRYCDETVAVPSPRDDLLAYRDALLSLAARPDVLTVIPVREEDVYVLAKYRDEFADHVATPWPSMDALRAVQDRVELFDAAAEAGVSAPDTHVLGADDDWERERIAKARYAVLADEYLDWYAPDQCASPPGTTYLEPGVEPDADAIRAEMGHTPIVQEYLSTTDEYGFFALYDRGEPVATFQHRQVRAYNYAGGPSAFRESVRIPALEDAGRALLDHLDWHGLAMVEFLRDEATGEFELMEINPRFWSSLPFTVQAGVDFPYYYWLVARGETDRVAADYDAGVAGHLLRGELSYLHSVAFDDVPLADRPALGTAAWDVASSLWRHPRFDYLQADDPRPFVRDLRNAVADLLDPAADDRPPARPPESDRDARAPTPDRP